MSKTLYKVTFLNHGKVYELYARRVDSGRLWGFVEVADLVFDTTSLSPEAAADALAARLAMPEDLPA